MFLFGARKGTLLANQQANSSCPLFIRFWPFFICCLTRIRSDCITICRNVFFFSLWLFSSQLYLQSKKHEIAFVYFGSGDITAHRTFTDLFGCTLYILIVPLPWLSISLFLLLVFRFRNWFYLLLFFLPFLCSHIIHLSPPGARCKLDVSWVSWRKEKKIVTHKI